MFAKFLMHFQIVRDSTCKNFLDPALMIECLHVCVSPSPTTEHALWSPSHLTQMPRAGLGWWLREEGPRLQNIVSNRSNHLSFFFCQEEFLIDLFLRSPLDFASSPFKAFQLGGPPLDVPCLRGKHHIKCHPSSALWPLCHSTQGGKWTDPTPDSILLLRKWDSLFFWAFSSWNFVTFNAQFCGGKWRGLERKYFYKSVQENQSGEKKQNWNSLFGFA